MGQKVEVGGTGYDLKGGKPLIGGTAYAIKKGRTLIGGTGYDISFASGVPLSELTPGTILYINESGSPVPFYVAKHDYESGLNGAGRTLVVRKDCYDMRVFDTSRNTYANSALDTWLCNTYLKLLNADIQAAVGTTKFYYTPGGSSTVTMLQRAVFQLSAAELGITASSVTTEGTTLPIASMLQIAYYNGSRSTQWTRSPFTQGGGYVSYLYTDGNAYGNYPDFSHGSRPSFTLTASIGVQDNGDGTYSLSE